MSQFQTIFFNGRVVKTTDRQAKKSGFLIKWKKMVFVNVEAENKSIPYPCLLF